MLLFIIKSILFLTTLVFLLEITLTILYRIFKKRVFVCKYQELCYPFFSWNKFKIAIYGDSAAAGVLTEVKLSEMIEYELNKRFKRHKKHIVMNFSGSGMPFHQGQDILTQEFLRKFDLTIIYSGNCEGQDYFNSHVISDSNENYRRGIRQHNQICRNRMKLFSIKRLKSYSNIFSFACALGMRLESKIIKRKPKHHKVKFCGKVCLVTDQPVYPVEQKKKDYNNFIESMRSVLEAGELYKKRVYVVGMLSNDFFPPNQSYCTSEDAIQKRYFHAD